MHRPASPPKRHPTNNPLFTPTPYQLRALVLDYLCHNCHTATAKAFVKDSAIRHLDADGDEIMQPGKGLSDTPAELAEEVLRLVELRERIRIAILSGRVADATMLLHKHFPSVLSKTKDSGFEPPTEQQQAADKWQYVSPTSVEPDHLSLNLRILAFIEACRTIPLPYNFTRGEHPLRVEQDTSHTTAQVCDERDPDATDSRQATLLAKAQKLYAAVHTIQKLSDRATYFMELRNVAGLLAYKIPEESPTSRYLNQDRREAVAEQVNRAILHRTGLPAVSHLELYARYTTTVWRILHDNRIKPPPPGSRPPGAKLPPATSEKSRNSPSTKNPDEPLPPFDLQQFLDSKI